MDLFPVNSGNVAPPPSQCAPIGSYQLNYSANNGSASPALGPNGLRRKRKEVPRPVHNLKLERILGLTTASSNILATAESQDLIAYAAGAVVVLYNHKKNKQVGFLYPPTVAASPVTAAGGTAAGIRPVATHPLSMTPLLAPLAGQAEFAVPGTRETDEKKNTPANQRAKPISCLTFSPNGNYLAADGPPT
ncbi:hypothetical protein CLU79DRAFT_22752 [Phycomyces nitens]|nr:hypothetical protein CLU79DRAFT_22752 [Phycomyces nitens]